MVYILIHLNCYNKMLQIVWLINCRSYLLLFWMMTLFDIRVLPAWLSSYGALYWGVDSRLPSESSHGGKDEGALWDLFIRVPVPVRASLVAQRVKHLPAMRETWDQSLGQEDPLEKEMATTPIPLPGRSHGPGSPVGYSPWGRKRSDATEWLHFH